MGWFPDEVAKMNILFPYVVRHLFRVVYGNRYLPRGSKEDVLYGIRTTSRFCHESLNLVTSVKIISSE